MTVKLGLVGTGTVGGGCIDILKNHREDFKRHYGIDVELVRVCSRNPEQAIAHGVEDFFTQDYQDILNDPDIDIVVELIGGTTVARDIVVGALKAGKNVVTANKALMATYGEEVMGAADEAGKEIAFEASVGGGIPIIDPMKHSLIANEISSVMGIVNGTTNYMLSAMTASGVDYTTCLREAQALGYAEADPTADVEGYDARRKLVLSANLAFGASVQEEEIPCFGISSVEKKDFAAWRELGRVCKLFVRAERHEGRISAFVCPTLFPAASPVAQTNGTGNLVTLRGARFGELSFSGAGAGGYPTGSSVLSDCVDVIEGCPSFYVSRHEAKHIDNSAAVGRFYLRTGSETVCTGPITVAEAFARAERARSCGEPVFLARIEEE